MSPKSPKTKKEANRHTTKKRKRNYRRRGSQSVGRSGSTVKFRSIRLYGASAAPSGGDNTLGRVIRGISLIGWGLECYESSCGQSASGCHFPSSEQDFRLESSFPYHVPELERITELEIHNAGVPRGMGSTVTFG